MPVLAEPPLSNEAAPLGQSLALAAESLYLINLLVLPGLGFLALLWLYFRRRANAAPLA